ncbi:MAG: hypothetical protein RMM29_00250 [Planctomycetota bacterium]|nr:hypothetical protein [Planctomycetota bacterium]MCX8039300.1 hypothetical protein [Planctomycetota bacterium]MDW8372065.1 hypothetical protein [Planctomycetota bacterium]
MSLALRIFILVLLVLTVAFMIVQMMLFATRENWKRRWDQDTKSLAAELKQATQLLATESAGRVRAENQVAQLQIDRDRDQAKIRELEAQITERVARIQALERDLDRMRTDYSALNENYQAQSKSLDMVRQRNSELTHIAQVARAVAFNLNVKLAEVEDDLNNLQTEYARLREQLDKSIAERKQAEARLAVLRERFPKVYEAIHYEQPSTAALHARVAAVQVNSKGEQEFVILSIGREEGVQVGQEFIVYRGNQYICKVRVERVLNDMAPARVIPSSWNTSGLTIEAGDLAANRL